MKNREIDPQRFKQIDHLLDVAFELKPDQVSAFLDEACAGDKALREEIERLIVSDQRDRGLFDSPAFDAAAELLKDDQGGRVSQQIGPSTLFSKLGGSAENKALLEPARMIAGR